MQVFNFDEPIHVYCFPPKRHEHERPNTRMACASAHTLSRKDKRYQGTSWRESPENSLSVRELGPIFADPGHCYIWNQLQGRQPGLDLIFCLRAQEMRHALRGRVLIRMMQECSRWHRRTRRRHDAQTFLLSSPDVLTVNTVP